MVDIAIPLWMYPILVWTIAWKAIASWKAARRGHLIWFVAFFIVNTVGILPMIYLFFFQNMKSVTKNKRRGKKVAKKKFPALFK